MRWLVISLIVLTDTGLTQRLLAADPQPYTVTLKPTDDKALDAALQGSSTLLSLRETAPVAGFALTERARQDAERFETALRSFGYYKATVTTTIGGHRLDDPALPGIIDAAPAKPPLEVAVSFDLGPRFRLGSVTISTKVPPDIPAHLELKPGQPAMASEVLAAQGRLLDALRADGFPLAKVPTPAAILHPDQNLLDVDFQPDAGPQADIGPISLSGLKDMNESFVRKRLLIHQGEKYSPEAIEKARQDLASIGVFSVVRVVPATGLDSHGQLPITFDFTERPLHSVNVGVAYSTDLGINFNTAWHDRNLFGNAEQLNLTAGNQLGGDAVTRPGYSAGAQFLKPDFLMRDQTLEIDLNAIDQSLLAYDQDALLEKIALNRKLTPQWTASLGLSGEQESIVQEGIKREYNLVGIPASLKYDSTTSLLDPTKGIRATLSVTPTESLGTPNATFIIAQLSGSTYFDIFDNGRSVLALRGLVGKVSGTDSLRPSARPALLRGGECDGSRLPLPDAGASIQGSRYPPAVPPSRPGRWSGGSAFSATMVSWGSWTWGRSVRTVRPLPASGVRGLASVRAITRRSAPFGWT